MPWTKAASVLSWESAEVQPTGGGVGMLQALGYDFLDKEGRQVPYGAQGLEILKTISDKNVLPELADCHFYIACDVTNMLCGDLGCSAVYGPQKERCNARDDCSDGPVAGTICGFGTPGLPESRSKAAGNGSGRRPQFAFLSFTNAQCWNPGLSWY